MKGFTASCSGQIEQLKQALETEELDTPTKVHDHYLARYGGLAGLAQQYIFHYARNKGGKI